MLRGTGANHAAHTTQELSAHLTVNVERQFYVWGALLQALAARLLLSKAAIKRLDHLSDMQPFGIEEEAGAWGARFVLTTSTELPMLVTMPVALRAHAEQKLPLRSSDLKDEWLTLLEHLHSVQYEGPLTVQVRRDQRRFDSLSDLVTALRKVEEQEQNSALEWVAQLLVASLPRQHNQHAQSRMPDSPASSQKGSPEQLGALAAARAAKFIQTQEVGATQAGSRVLPTDL